MAYRIFPDGTIEGDTLKEVLELRNALHSRKKHVIVNQIPEVPGDVTPEALVTLLLQSCSRSRRQIGYEVIKAGKEGIFTADLIRKTNASQSDISRMLKFFKTSAVDVGLKPNSLVFSKKYGKQSKWFAGSVLLKIGCQIYPDLKLSIETPEKT